VDHNTPHPPNTGSRSPIVPIHCEITVNHKTSEGLEEAIKERIKRLLNANIVDVTPLTDSLDEELGIADPDPRLDPNPSIDDPDPDTEPT
jgi:hypothetical protein